jgi:hypothetical protein
MGARLHPAGHIGGGLKSVVGENGAPGVNMMGTQFIGKFQSTSDAEVQTGSKAPALDAGLLA